MKVLVRLLGHYGNLVPFYLYQIPDSTLLLFRLNDITSLFHVPDLARHPLLTQVPRGECYRILEAGDDYYVSTQVLAQAAVAMNRFRLAELCKLKANDYAVGLADGILSCIKDLELVRNKAEPVITKDLPWSPVVSPISSPKRQARGHPTSPPITSIKPEPQTPPPLRLSQPAETTSPATHVLQSQQQPSLDSHRSSSLTRPHPDDEPATNKRQRTDRKVLMKPSHTVSSQAPMLTNDKQDLPRLRNNLGSNNNQQTLLAKRQGKNSRNLTIYAPSYADQLAVSVRSAPLHSNFRQLAPNGYPPPPPPPPSTTQSSLAYNVNGHPKNLHLHPLASNGSAHPVQHTPSSTSQHHPVFAPPGSLQHHALPHQQSSHPPLSHQRNAHPSKYLQPGHTLAPLLSPRAAPVLSSQQPHHHPFHHHHPEPKTTGGAIGKQEFAIPPIQQPPHTAHPGSNHGFGSAAGFARASSNHASSSNTTSNNNTTNNTNGNTNATSSNLPLTAAAAPMPPQTPTTYSFAALQRQQFLQPFEHLFDTIETTRTLKNTLDDQIRRSSTLLQTLQASTTTIEGLVRSQVKEVQRDVMHRMEEVIDTMVKRIAQLETKLDISPTSNPNNDSAPPVTTPTPTPPSSSCNGQNHLKSPPTIVRSQNDIGPSECHAMLDTLRERLDRLESQLDK
ncbi:hypothetical protein DM01DRAFT_1367063 [Hesseltinella vesiculosa]|uniref:Uncharacterized protein n=1 Tax=Hesseltinella vesiculosa TaxID=101127 RepID=A0A1X2GIE2_9FUNG|nr:hypothetical protein DM01DRAFT_1367063 [Hesseltinella vesiculosa]